MSGRARERFRASIGAALGVPSESVSLFARGRVALYAILRALDIGPGDEVILPAFTCVAVPNAILYAGARPVWVDIDPRTYTVDPAAAEAAITPRTRLILAQNAFGLSADLVALEAVAELHGLEVVDDCCQGLGGRDRGRLNGTTAPLSFFSTQWSKPISTGLGGFAVAQGEAMARRLRGLEADAVEPSPLRVAALRALFLARGRAGRGSVFRAGRTAYRALSRVGLVPGSSSRDELEGTTMPERFLARLSEPQAAFGVRGMADLAAAVARRQAIAHRYSGWLSEHGRTAAEEPADSEHAFLRYPLRVNDRSRFRAAAERVGVDLGDWFVSPIHPLTEGLERWAFLPGSAPHAERAAREMVNLPIDASLGEHDVERVLAFLARQLDLVR
jgi:dTDP-4-amino-4,6-dideoxygalactose transaminase